MKRLTDAKVEGGYYGAHKRVVLKELVEMLRTTNQELEEKIKARAEVEGKYQKAQKELFLRENELATYFNKKEE
jgi:phosphoglycerate-specific signal transduction histidine kinase